MAKLKAESLALAIKAEEETMQAEARAAMQARQRFAAAEETRRRIEERERQETAQLLLDQQNRDAEERAAAERVAALVRQRIAVSEENKLIIAEREREEAAKLELEQQNQALEQQHLLLAQQNREAEESLVAVCNGRIEAERLAIDATEGRIAAEQHAAELARRRDFAELLAHQAANEKIAMQEQAIAALRQSEELERGLTGKVKDELHQAKIQLETGKLLQRLSRTHRINRFSQVALSGLLLLVAGMWLAGVGSNARTESAANNGKIVMAQSALEKPASESADLGNLKLSANLGGSPSMQGIRGPAEKEF
jgi:hypothetical protein